MTVIRPAPTASALLAAGDPLADAVVAELDLYGTRARRVLDAGLTGGLADLDERPTEAVGALLEQLETAAPSSLDPLVLHRGDLVSLSVPPMWSGICSIPSALAYRYASPSLARLQAGTGRPTTTALARLVEVRLRHARLRATALERGEDPAGPGLPVGQADLARAWLGCTLVPFQALAAVGIEIDPEEERRLYLYWSHGARLLGLAESLHEDVVDHASARRLRDLLDCATAAPDENSRVLTQTMIDAQAHAMAAAPGADLSEDQLRALIQTVLRRTFGDDGTADRLGIPVPTATDPMPLISTLNRQARYWQTFSPASAQAARRQAHEVPGAEPIAAVTPLNIPLQRQAGAGRRAVPAA